MTQYQSIKANYPDAILFFRMGDFYEMFHDDAKLAAEELKLVLTAREKNSAKAIPMAGIPHHAYKGYAAKLLRKGYKVAICEQTSEPKPGKGIVDREVVRVLTPGTVLDEDLLSEGIYNYLAALAKDGETVALVQVDVSTGEAVGSTARGPEALTHLCEELLRSRPAELLLTKELGAHPELARVILELDLSEASVTQVERASRPSAQALKTFFGGKVPPAASVDPALGKSLGLLHAYLERTHGDLFGHFTRLEVADLRARMQLDPATVRNLELTETLLDRTREGSLLGVLDKAATSMGSRLLRSWVLHPLKDRTELETRYEAVGALVRSLEARRELRQGLKRVYDIPRCLGRISSGNPSPRDLVLLRSSLEAFPELHEAANRAGLGGQAEDLLGLEDLYDLLCEAIADDPPLHISEGGVIRAGYHDELEELRGLSSHAKDWIERLQEAERKRTGIKSLKIKFNKVFGYYLEVTRSNLHLVPEDYQRKQTLVNGERYITPELKQKESEILGAEEKSKALELELFRDLRERIAERFLPLQAAAKAASRLDVYCTLAQVAEERGYVRPELVEEPILEVVDGRHPVVEALAPSGEFVPNSLAMDPLEATSLILLTGPNMSGKSTFLRQTALIQLLAQVGSFVPATSARLGLVDRIFTRVGASDDLSRGESTFMVEMRETAFILGCVTDRSLVILDEIGRGTATYDGLSIAWAIVEHLAAKDESGGPKVLFATHYHELTSLGDLHRAISNFSVSVEEEGEDILFLHRVEPGPADKSYGIHVARLAGFPEVVVRRARVLLEDLERDSGKQRIRREAPPPRSSRAKNSVVTKKEAEPVQLTLFRAGPDPIVEELRKLDPLNMTPMQALQELLRLKGLSE
jgi:DNA mismatch repair protein MutS